MSVWKKTEAYASFECEKTLKRSLGSGKIVLGFIFCAIGSNFGSSPQTSRYIIVIPFYDPTTQASTFTRIDHPYVYFRVFTINCSMSYYENLNVSWLEHCNLIPQGSERSFMLTCSPVRVMDGNDFSTLSYQSVVREKSDSSSLTCLSLVVGSFQFWLIPPTQVDTLKKVPTDSLFGFINLLDLYFSKDSAIRHKAVDDMVTFFEFILASTYCYNFPKIYIVIKMDEWAQFSILY